jgi:hypothetical protein
MGVGHVLTQIIDEEPTQKPCLSVNAICERAAIVNYVHNTTRIPHIMGFNRLTVIM